MAIAVASFFFVLSGIEYFRKKKRQERELKQKEILTRQEKLRAIEKEKQRQEEVKVMKDKQKLDAMNAIRMEQERRFAEEQKLKNRSAEDAVNEALKHFM